VTTRAFLGDSGGIDAYTVAFSNNAASARMAFVASILSFDVKPSYALA